MGRLILDTSVLVGMERGTRRAFDAIADDDDVAIAAITVAELLVGVARATGRRRAARSAFVEEVLETVPIVDYTTATARAHADLLAATAKPGAHRGAHDLIIGATAAATGRAVVTTDPRGFDGLPGVEVVTAPR
ncbi:MAG TPA: PIN domain-containing protein [Actinomycetota bacterium]|nr:PIN domain-containing protein [Actinomycetota bacterium]